MPRVAGVPVSLVSVQTRDGVVLDGVAANPRGRRRTALIWVHGLGSTFSSGQPLIRALSASLNAAGIGYLKLNTRGHGVVTRAGKRLAVDAVRGRFAGDDAANALITRQYRKPYVV